MLRLIGAITVAILVSIPIYGLELYTNGDFISRVLEQETLSIMATLLGLNLATASFLVATLTTVEQKAGGTFFDDARKEIKQNLQLLIGLFFAAFILLMIGTANLPNIVSEIKKILLLALILLSIYAFYQMTNAIFSFHKGLNGQSKK